MAIASRPPLEHTVQPATVRRRHSGRALLTIPREASHWLTRRPASANGIGLDRRPSAGPRGLGHVRAAFAVGGEVLGGRGWSGGRDVSMQASWRVRVAGWDEVVGAADPLDGRWLP